MTEAHLITCHVTYNLAILALMKTESKKSAKAKT